MPGLTLDLWDLVYGGPQIDPGDLAAALQRQVAATPLDYRTRLLIRDSLDALKHHWGAERLTRWLAGCPARQRLESIWGEDFERPGFTLIGRRLMEKTHPDAIRNLLAELGNRIRHSVRLEVGGSAALILPGHISRHTEDIDVVDEVPQELRSQYALLDEFKQRYGLLITQFGSHYLPTGWKNRLYFFGDFGALHVYLVDVYDIFVGKLFSKRTKDLDDLRMLAPQLDKAAIEQRLKGSTAALQNDPNLLSLAQNNWSIVFGEAFPK
jgi:hypothetical protein